MAHGGYSLAVHDFKSKSDDLSVWVKLFEDSVKLAYRDADEAAIGELCIQWLPFKLDEEARIIHGSVTKAKWPEIKTELRNLLVDPQEAYNWKARHATIVWDGKESLHSLATRIKRAVDKFDPDCNKVQEYFFRFRLSLPPDYRKAIDIGCTEDKETIEDAKKLAGRIRLANSDQAEFAAAPGKAVAFTGASMSDDRCRAVELGLQSMSVKVGNIESELTERKKKEDLPSKLKPDRERFSDRSLGRRPDGDWSRVREDRGRGTSGSRDGRRRPDSRDRYRSRRDSFDGRDYEQRDDRDRYRRDSYDRRHGYDRDDYDRRPSYDSRESDHHDYDHNRRPDNRDAGYDYDRRGDWGNNRSRREHAEEEDEFRSCRSEATDGRGRVNNRPSNERVDRLCLALKANKVNDRAQRRGK